MSPLASDVLYGGRLGSDGITKFKIYFLYPIILL